MSQVILRMLPVELSSFSQGAAVFSKNRGELGSRWNSDAAPATVMKVRRGRQPLGRGSREGATTG